MNSPLLSVMIPTINRVDSVIRGIESIGIEKGVEIVIVDDGSEDAVYRALQERLAGQAGVSLFRNPSNLGLVKNWNECIRRSRGQWLSLLCSDDYFRAGAIRRILGLIAKAPPRLIIQAPHIGEGEMLLSAGHDCAATIRLPIASGNVWHSSISRAIGGFDEELKYSPDAEYWYRIANDYDVLQVKEPFAEYVCHDANYMWDTWRKKDFIDQVRILARKNAAYIQNDNSSTAIAEIEKKAVQDTIVTMLFTSAGNRRHSLFYKTIALARDNNLPRSCVAKAVMAYIRELLLIPSMRRAAGRIKRRILAHFKHRKAKQSVLSNGN